MYRLIVLILIVPLCTTGSAQPKKLHEGEGAFNTKTGDTLTYDEWMSVLPDTFDLFSSEEPYEIALESDFRKFNKEKYNDRYQHALLHFKLSDSIVIKRRIRIKPRGKSRLSTCNPPPIKLNFKKTEFYGKSIQQLEKMKMVAECRSGQRDYVLEEYLIYKIYNLLTDLSFKARLVHIRYLNTGANRRKESSSYGFLIEEIDDLVKRKDMLEIKVSNASQEDILEDNMAVFSMFQYMIGNTDWSIGGRHNVKLMKPDLVVSEKLNLVPYDFDYSGFVNTYYAVPSEDFGLKNVRERLFRCKCYSEETFQNTVNLFLSKKEAIFQLIDEFPLLLATEKKDIKNYTLQFYSQIEGKNPTYYFMKECGRFLR